jgi:hypothetical protein
MPGRNLSGDRPVYKHISDTQPDLNDLVLTATFGPSRCLIRTFNAKRGSATVVRSRISYLGGACAWVLRL